MVYIIINKRIVFLIGIICIIMGFTNMVYASDIPTNKPKEFYDYLVEEGLPTQEAYYVNDEDMVYFVTQSTLSTAGIRYRNVGYQMRVDLGGKKIWTIIPLGRKGLSEVKSTHGNEEYYTLSISQNNIKKLIQREFVDTGKISPSDLSKFNLNRVVFDGVFTISKNGVPQGKLNADGTIPSGSEVYLSMSGLNSVEAMGSIRFDSSVNRVTSYDNSKNGILGAAGWSNTAISDIESRYNIKVRAMLNDLGIVQPNGKSSPVSLWNSERIYKYDKGESLTLRFRVSHLKGERTIGLNAVRNPLAKVRYTIKDAKTGELLVDNRVQSTGLLKPGAETLTINTPNFKTNFHNIVNNM